MRKFKNVNELVNELKPDYPVYCIRQESIKKSTKYFQDNFPESKIIIYDCFRNDETFPNGNLKSFGHYKNLIGFNGSVHCGNINNKDDLSIHYAGKKNAFARFLSPQRRLKLKKIIERYKSRLS